MQSYKKSKSEAERRLGWGGGGENSRGLVVAKAMLIQLRWPPGECQWGAHCREWTRQTQKQMGQEKWRRFSLAGAESIAFSWCSSCRDWQTTPRGPNPTTYLFSCGPRSWEWFLHFQAVENKQANKSIIFHDMRKLHEMQTSVSVNKVSLECCGCDLCFM